MGVYDDIRQGLEQAIEYEQGKISARKTTLTILPLSTFTSAEIKAIRLGTGLTQASFAKFMGVCVKTVEAWEAGRNRPDGSARRLLAIARNDPSFPVSSGIVTK